MGSLNLAPASVEDYRREAEIKLPRFLFDYLDGGAYAERTLRNNVHDFEALALNQRVLRDVSSVSTDTIVCDTPMTIPAALAPIGMGGMYARRGEVQAKKAADSVGIPFTLSTVSICSMEEVSAVSDKPIWFQLYMLKDRSVATSLMARAKACGVKTLLFTVDLPVLGARYRDVRNGLSGTPSAWAKFRSGPMDYALHPSWSIDVGLRGGPHTFGNLTEYVKNSTTPKDFQHWINGQFDASATWKDIGWLREHWDGKFIVKGILNPDDAREAIAAGADGVVVSNHGGRQLDGVSSSIAMLPRIVDSIGDRAEVIIDSGIRSGQDIVKAVALGAKAGLIGRPWVYSVAARGESGVSKMLSTMKGEMEVSMALTGVTNIHEIDATILGTNT